MTDWGELYKDNVAAVSGLADDLTEEQLGTTVPATPNWTVKQVYQHLAGESWDATHDRMAGAPGDEWTAQHTGERDDVPIGDLVAELQEHQDQIAAAMAEAKTPAMVWDIAVHHTDLHEALGLGQPPERLWQPVAEAVAARTPDGVADQVSSYELFRGAFSRRSVDQMEGWDTGADREALEGMCIFGPRDDAQPVP